MNKPDYHAILHEAHGHAVAAQVGMVEGKGLDCGFAWVTIDGTHPLARYCRAQRKEEARIRGVRPDHFSTSLDGFYGDKGYPRGWQWGMPGNHSGQSIGIHEAGARAFRDVLAKHNITATVGSRYD